MNGKKINVYLYDLASIRIGSGTGIGTEFSFVLVCLIDRGVVFVAAPASTHGNIGGHRCSPENSGYTLQEIGFASDCIGTSAVVAIQFT